MTNVNPWLMAAALATLATCAAHVFVGGRLFARPLLRSELRSPVKRANYWRLVTAALALAFFAIVTALAVADLTHG